MNCESIEPATIPHVRGDRLTVKLTFNGDRSEGLLALVDALDGATWASDVKNSAGELVGSCEVTAVRVGNVLTVLAIMDDTEALEAAKTYSTDVQATGDAIGRKTFIPGTQVYVTGDVTADTP